MKYDTSISTSVPLFRVLDEMLLGDTSRETVVSFLKSHEKDIPDIFSRSAFVYDLYDLYYLSPSDFDGFLIENAIHLQKADCMFFCSNFLSDISVSSSNWGKIIDLRTKMENKHRGAFMFGRYGGWNWRTRNDEDIAEGRMNLVAYVNSIKDDKDMKSFLIHSRFARSMFRVENFLSLDARSQCLFLTALFDNKNYTYRDNYSEKSRNVTTILAEMMATLLKQLLVVENVEMFNWVMNVSKNFSHMNPHSLSFMDDVRNVFEARTPNSLMKMVNKRLWRNNDESAELFTEVVFEMNMLETQFEPLDLFLLFYLLPQEVATTVLRGKDDGNLDLMDFFNLPFDWRELEYLKTGNDGK